MAENLLPPSGSVLTRSYENANNPSPRLHGRGAEMDASRFVTRREALQAGALAAGTLAGLEVEPAAARSHEAAVAQRAPRIRRSFDQGWLFFRGDASGAEAPAFDDSSWRKLDVPHDWSIE